MRSSTVVSLHGLREFSSSRSTSPTITSSSKSIFRQLSAFKVTPRIIFRSNHPNQQASQHRCSFFVNLLSKIIGINKSEEDARITSATVKKRYTEVMVDMMAHMLLERGIGFKRPPRSLSDKMLLSLCVQRYNCYLKTMDKNSAIYLLCNQSLHHFIMPPISQVACQ